MVSEKQPSSTQECIALLHSVLNCLDKASDDHHTQADGEQLSLAAAHVQQAIELIQSVDQSDS